MNRKNCFSGWLAYQKAEDLAHAIFLLTNDFPKVEKYSLTDQMRRSSRSVCSNLAEGHAKRAYVKHFYAKLTDALGENNETLSWLRFARRCRYIDDDGYHKFAALNAEVGKLLSYMMNNPKKFGAH
ncbi:MAG: four helix bundle protein [Lewinella sp.]